MHAGRTVLIDVRSEGEFAQGALPHSVNAPILNDAERHQVGLTYKQQGQEAAVALGYRLVEPLIEERRSRWVELARGSPEQAIVTCWRGGMRSALATEQMRLGGVTPERVTGGYKAMRGELLKSAAAPRQLVVVGGLTGSGKTELIQSLATPYKIDLEALARHRGSAFGSFAGDPQPAQQTFENALGFALWGTSRPLVLEDESILVGKVRIPPPFFQSMLGAPVVMVETPLAERVRRIHDEYMVSPLRSGVPRELLAQKLLQEIENLKRRLGGELTQRITVGVGLALAKRDTSLEAHAPWIEALLVQYYDKRYLYSFKRTPRPVVYRGTLEECRSWIQARYA